jgi:hypothetical protein
MIKFIFPFMALVVFSKKSIFWLPCSLIVILIVCFSFLNLSGTSLNMLGYIVGLDSLSFRLIFLSF